MKQPLPPTDHDEVACLRRRLSALELAVLTGESTPAKSGGVELLLLGLLCGFVAGALLVAAGAREVT